MSLPGRELARPGGTLREYEVLRALIRTGKTTAAAHRLGVSQPAVSRALASLEARLGRRLFDRDGGRLSPTAEALKLGEELEQVFAALARIGESAAANRRAAILRVAAPPTIAHAFLRRHVASFARAHPDVQLSLDVVASDVLVTLVAEGRVDVAMSDSFSSHAGVRLEPFRRTEAICLLPLGHRLTRQVLVHAHDLAGEPFIALTRRHSVRIAVDEMFRNLGIEARIAVETSTSMSAAEFVRDGLGIALLNPFPIEAIAEGVDMRPFAPSIPYLAAFLLPGSGQRKALVSDFVAHVRQGSSPSPVSPE